MPAKSQAQQKLFALVNKCQKSGICLSEKIKSLADNMSKKDVRDFAKTKLDKLPERKTFKEFVDEQDEDIGGAFGIEFNKILNLARTSNLSITQKSKILTDFIKALNVPPYMISTILTPLEKEEEKL